MSKGKYADSKYDGYRTSLEAYLKSRSLIGENPNYSANDHINNYDRYGWSKYDLNNVVLTPEQHRELDAIWGDDYDLFIQHVESLMMNLIIIADLMSSGGSTGYIAVGRQVPKVVFKESAKQSTNGIKLSKQLASESQMSQAGRTIIRSLKSGPRLARQYGGKATDWVKKTSSSYSKNGKTFETHWYENISTGQRVEFKTKLIK